MSQKCEQFSYEVFVSDCLRSLVLNGRTSCSIRRVGRNLKYPLNLPPQLPNTNGNRGLHKNASSFTMHCSCSPKDFGHCSRHNSRSWDSMGTSPRFRLYASYGMVAHRLLSTTLAPSPTPPTNPTTSTDSHGSHRLQPLPRPPTTPAKSNGSRCLPPTPTTSVNSHRLP